VSNSSSLVVAAARAPAFVAAAGARASYRFVEFFTAQIRNPHTRRAYARAATEFFDWLEAKGVTQLASSSGGARDSRRPRSCAWPPCVTCSIGWLSGRSCRPIRPPLCGAAPHAAGKRLVDAEVKGLRDLLAEVKANRDELRQDRDGWRGRAERLLTDQRRPWWRRLVG